MMRNRIVLILPFLQFAIAMVTLWKLEQGPPNLICQPYDTVVICRPHEPHETI
jgi:hypothetical protein